MRKFFLQNGIGERLNLMGEGGIYFLSPSGLGIEYKDRFVSLKNGFYKRVEEEQSQGTIPGTLIFLDPAYEKYQKFVNFCETADPLFLVYAPLGTEYYCEIKLGSLEKSELTIYEASLQSKVQFISTTMWYTMNDVVLNFGEGATVSRYPGRYNSLARYGSRGQGIVYVRTRGHTPAAVKITALGAATNPSIKLIGVSSGKTYGECAISGEFTSGEGFELCTKYQDGYIRKITNDGDGEDLIDAIDVTLNPFFHVPMNEKCMVQVTGGSELTLGGALYDYYRSV